MSSRLKNSIAIVSGLILVIGVVVYTSIKMSDAIPPYALVATSSMTEQQVAKATEELNSFPKDQKKYSILGNLYFQLLRETGNINYYATISTIIKKAKKLDPNNADINFLEATIEVSKHNFIEAKPLIEKAIALHPTKDTYYGLLADINVELGNYGEAEKILQKMIDLRPTFGSYSRIAYFRELHGDIAGAEQALQFAIDAGSTYPENVAWAYTELAKLESRTSTEKARTHYNTALNLVKDYPAALSGLGKEAYFSHNEIEAETYFLAAYKKLPDAFTTTNLADFYFVTGKQEKAKKYYVLAQSAFTNSREQGVNVDFEESVFLNENNLDNKAALSFAEKAYTTRKNIFTRDNLAFSYFKNGEYAKAQVYASSTESFALTDPIILYHQGVLELKNGNIQAGRKLLQVSLQKNSKSKMRSVFEIRNILKETN